VSFIRVVSERVSGRHSDCHSAGCVDGKLPTIRQRPLKFALKLIGGTLRRDQSGRGVAVWNGPAFCLRSVIHHTDCTL